MDEDAGLAAAYWREHRLATGNREERLRAEADDAASSAVADRISGDPVAALLLLDALLAADDADLGYAGAGPVEDLLVEHGPKVGEAVADRCRQSNHWRQAVAGVWLDDRERAEIPTLHPFLPHEYDPLIKNRQRR